MQKYLVELKSDINTKSKNGMTVLHSICKEPCFTMELVSFFIENKSDVNEKNINNANNR